MILWVDAQLPPSLVIWLRQVLGVEAQALRDLGLRDAQDIDIFLAARQAGAAVITKDGDFAYLVEQHGAPPRILWIRSGNTSNDRLKAVLHAVLPQALRLLEDQHLVIVNDPP